MYRKITIRKQDMLYYALCLYTCAIMWADNTKLFYLCALIFGGLAGVMLLKKRKIRLDIYPCLHGLFIVFCAVCAVAGFTILPGVVYKRCAVMAVNLFICCAAASQLMDDEKRRRYLHFFCVVALVFELYIIVMSGSNLFKGRLGEYAYSPISYRGTYNANFVGSILLYALMFDLEHYLTEKRKSSLIRCGIYLLGILLTGSRKGIVSAGVVLFLLPMLDIFQKRRAVFYKVLRYIFIGGLICAVGLVMLFKIPALYEIAGQRVEAMLAGIVSAGAETDSSLEYRDMFIDYAKMYFHQSPVVGIGIDNFKYVNFIEGYYAHNNYWEILTGSGIIGGCIYYATYLVLGIRLWKAKKRGTQNALAMLVYLCVMVLTDYYMVSYLERLNLLLMFVAFSVTMRDREAKLERRVKGSETIHRNCLQQ